MTAPSLTDRTWKHFKLGDLFTLRKGRRLTKANMAPGSVPYVGAIDKNNGVRQHIANTTHLHDGGTITVNYNGSVGEAFYQPEPFWASDDVNVLYPKFDMTPAVALFICTVIRHEKYRYNYGRKWHLERMQESVIQLPVDTEGRPDLDFMASFIKAQPFGNTEALSHVPEAAIPTAQPITLNPTTWKPFKLGDLFTLRKGRRLTKADMAPGSVPYIGAIDKNNGVRQHIANTAHLHNGGTITVNYDGSIGEAFYQPSPFWASDSVNVLYPKFDMTPAVALFICTVVRHEKYRYNYGRKWHLERMQDTAISLPTEASGQPDWQFMESYIKSLPYSSQLEPEASRAAPDA